MQPRDWPAEIHRELAAAGVGIVGYVPDAGHKRLIEMCQADRRMRAVVLTTEEEGIGLAAGAWLGGDKSVLLMQSSGVGNVINALGLLKTCRFPLVMIVTMRGQPGEFNSWQVPMGEGTPAVFEAMGVEVKTVLDANDASSTVKAFLREAFADGRGIAVLIAQRVIGIKSFEEQASK